MALVQLAPNELSESYSSCCACCSLFWFVFLVKMCHTSGFSLIPNSCFQNEHSFFSSISPQKMFLQQAVYSYCRGIFIEQISIAIFKTSRGKSPHTWHVEKGLSNSLRHVSCFLRGKEDQWHVQCSSGAEKFPAFHVNPCVEQTVSRACRLSSYVTGVGG